MINLEWLRTFRAVYRTKSLSRASEMLNISQPTVSQHIQALEAHLSQKLFIRKSKGVIDTDDGRILNSLIAGSIESLEEAENIISQKYFKQNPIITIGISNHLYKSVLAPYLLELGEYVHVKYGDRATLLRDVEEGKLLYAIIPDEANTFDTICNTLFFQTLVVVGTFDVELGDLKTLKRTDCQTVEEILTKQTWYSHDAIPSYIKLLWLNVFNKKRPNVIPNVIVPDEYEMLVQLAKGSGITVAVDTMIQPFIENGSLKIIEFDTVPFRNISLISNKKKAPKKTTEKIIKLLSK